MRLLLAFVLIISGIEGQVKDPRGPVTCEGGKLAVVIKDSYCCIENGLKYCCKKSNPLICFTEEMEAKTGIGRSESEESEQPTGPTERDDLRIFKNVHKKVEVPCSPVKLHRTGLSTLRVIEGKILKLVTLAFNQAESCDPETELSIRWGNLEPGRDYQILFGDNPDCGASKNDHTFEVARMEVTARSGNVQVPSVVPHLREVKGKQVSLRVLPTEETYACGTLTVFGL